MRPINAPAKISSLPCRSCAEIAKLQTYLAHYLLPNRPFSSVALLERSYEPPPRPVSLSRAVVVPFFFVSVDLCRLGPANLGHLDLRDIFHLAFYRAVLSSSLPCTVCCTPQSHELEARRDLIPIILTGQFPARLVPGDKQRSYKGVHKRLLDRPPSTPARRASARHTPAPDRPQPHGCVPLPPTSTLSDFTSASQQFL